MSHFSLQARWVLPVDRPPIADGVVTIADGKISAVGDRSAIAGRLHDLGDVVLMPGLVNAHTHLEFSQLKEPLGHSGMLLPEWIRLVIASRQRGRRNVNTATMSGLRESSRQGVTTVGDIATGTSYLDTVDHHTSSAASRLVPEPDPLQLVSFQEAIGFSAPRIDSALADLEQRLQNSRDSTNRRRTAALPRAGTPRLTGSGISPHAPYTVHPQLLERLVDLACEQNLPVAMHLAESSAELEFLASASGPFRDLLAERSMWDDSAIPSGSKPLDYLQVLARAPRSLVVHGNYLSPAEIRFLALQQEKMSVVYCPRTHAYFEHSVYPLQQMMAAGVRVALGTDSRASNPDLSLLSEMRFVARHHTDIAPQQIVSMGTLDGAEALGFGDVVGSITPGKWADLVAVPCETASGEPEAALLHSNEAPVQTWVRGRSIQTDSTAPGTS